MFSKWNCKVSSLEGGIAASINPSEQRRAAYGVPQRCKAQNIGFPLTTKRWAKSYSFPSDLWSSYINHKSSYNCYGTLCQKPCWLFPDTFMPFICLEISYMSHRQIQTLQRNHLKSVSSHRRKTKVWSSHKTKAKGYSLKQTDLNMSYFFIFSTLFYLEENLPQHAKSYASTGREGDCFLPRAQGCRIWPPANTASEQEMCALFHFLSSFLYDGNQQKRG